MKTRLSFAVALLACAPLGSAAAAERGERLYRMTLLRAAPGRLLELVSEARSKAPLVLRHSQGDHWDLMLLAPIGSYTEYFAGKNGAPPLVSPALVAWQEDTFVRGPDLAGIEGFGAARLYHIEMFVAIAEKRPELVKEREMENAYQGSLGRPRNAIFVRDLGGSWDAFTIGAYKSWKHYAERDEIAPEKALAAARAAGFERDDRIGPYLRSLIQTHHDTLATPVR